MSMRPRPSLAVLAAFALVTLAAPPLHAQVTRNFTTYAHKNDYAVPVAGQPYAYSACWSYVHGDGREYAVIGTSGGTAIYRVDVANPALTTWVGFIPGPPSIWREIKSYREWLYIVTEGEGAGAGLQIVRMANPDAPVLAATYTTNFIKSHTVAVDTARAILICNGTRRTNGTASGMRILSIANPEAPVEIAKWPASPDTVPSSQYVHDAVPIGNRLYASSIYSRIQRVFDFTTPSAPVQLAGWTYPNAYYPHNAWPDSTGNFIYVTDEQNGQTLRVFDIANLGAPQLVNGITSNPKAIVHNAHVKGRELYVSNYTEGIRAFDLQDPAHPAEFGWADSYPGPSGGYGGVWEVCPFFPSGTVIASDMQTGLYVYRPVRDYGVLRVKVVDASNQQPMAGVRVRLTSQGDSLDTPADGIVQFAPSPGTHTVLAHAFGWNDASATRTLIGGQRDTLVLALSLKPTITFTGTIRDAGTNAPLPGAELRIAYTSLHAHADASGVYALSGIPDDVYTLEIGRAGYAPVSLARRIGPGYPGTDFRLEPADTHDAFDVASGWTAGLAGDTPGSGPWTRVTPLGTGQRPSATGIAAHHALTPERDAGRAATIGFRPDAVSPLDAQHEEPAVLITANAAPYTDHTPEGTMCFVTGQGNDTLLVDQADVDIGRTTLTSPAYDMAGMTSPTIGYWRWFFSLHPGTEQPDDNDWLAVLISNDNGANWVPVDTTRGVANHWQERAIRVADYVTPTSQVRVRFVAADLGDNSTVEAGIDDVTTYDATGATHVDPGAVASLRFRAPAPNPSSGAVRFALELPVAGDVRIDVLDVGGRRVRVLYDGRATAGALVLAWDGRDGDGRDTPAGVYFARARAGGHEARTRLVRIR